VPVAFIGMGAMVLKGVTIGCIVDARVVVLSDAPDGPILAGKRPGVAKLGEDFIQKSLTN
jgi:acetyltransferase-like isoleucine patch superfamily enzyme